MTENGDDQSSEEPSNETTPNSGETKKEKKPGFWSKHFEKHPKQYLWFKRFRKLYVFYLLFCIIIAMPTARAMFRPVVQLFGPAELQIDQTAPVFTSKEKPSFIVKSTTCDRYNLRVFKREDFVETRHYIESNLPCNDVAVNPSVDDCYGSERSFRSGSKPVYEEFNFLIANDLFFADKKIQLSTLPPGDYVAMFSGYNGFRRHADVELRSIRVTDLGLITKQDNNQLLIQTVGLLDGKMKAGVPADLYFRDHDSSDEAQHRLTKVGSIKTGSDGNFLFKRPKNMSDGDWEHLTVDATFEGSRAYQGEMLTSTFHISDYRNTQHYNVWKQGYRVFLKGDRPIYKLGNKIQFKGIVRCITDVGLKNVGSGQEIMVQVSDPSGNQSTSIKLTTDQFGTFNGSYDIPATGQTGWYDFSISTIDGESHSFRMCVEQYRKPEFVITVQPEKKVTFSGEKLRIKVLGSYYFGGAVQGAEVKYTIRTSPNWEARMALFDNPFDDRSSYFGANLNKKGVVKTNDLGEAVIEVDTKGLFDNKPKSRLYNFGDAEIIADVELTDTTNHKTQMASGSAVCAQANLALNVGVSNRIIDAGKPIELKIRAATFEGKVPEPRKIKLELYKEVRKNILSDEWEDKVFSTSEAMTGKDGTATASIPTTENLESGFYYISCQSTDTEGRTTGSTVHVDIVSETIGTIDENQPLEISFDKAQFKRNEEARVIISTNLKKGESKDILVSIEGAKLHEYRLIHASSPTSIVPIKIKDEYAPQAWVTAVLVEQDHSARIVSEKLNVDPSFHYLNVELTPLKKAYRAGDTAQCKVKVKYQDGKPATNSQICFSMSDESIYAVARETMRNQYYGVNNNTAIEQAFYTDVENRVTTRSSFEKPWETSLEKKTFVDQVGLYAVLAQFWPVLVVTTGRMSECEADFCQKKADLECKMSATAGATPREESRQALRMEGLATKETAIERPKTFGYENGGAEPRVRKDFNDTAAWYPSIMTDAKGEATISIKLPDDLTTWKGECNVTDTQTNVGSQTTTILTTQDFIARLGLPRFFTQGDKTIIEGTVNNYSETPQSVRLTLVVTPQLKIGVPLTATINVPKGGQTTQRWPVEVVGEGEAQVTFKAVGGTASDALVQKLPCRPLGYRAFFAKAGVIKDEKGARPFPINIPADAKLQTGSFEMTLSSSQIGPVLGSFDTLIDYPYGCTEQTLSRLIPSVVAMRLHTELNVDLSESSKQKFQQVYDIAMPKLSEYQHPDGGWGWWKTDESRAFLTAQVLEGFFWLEKAEYSVDRDHVDNGLRYLETAANSIFSTQWERENCVDHAKALYVLSLYGKNLTMPQKAWQLTKLKSLPPEALAYLTMAFKNNGDSETAQIFYDRLLELKNESEDYNNWDHTREMINKFDSNLSLWAYTYRFTGVETTALALRAVLAMEPQKDELIDSIVKWIILQRDENGWNNTKSTSQVFVALLERELATRPDRTTHFTAKVTSGQKLLSMLQFDKPVENTEHVVKIGINPKPDHIKLEKTGPGWLYYTSLLQYDRPLRPGEKVIAKSKPADLKITREFFSLIPYDSQKRPMTREQARTSGVAFYVREPIGDQPIHAGDVIQMRVAIDSPITIPYVMVESALPSGGEVITKYMSVIDKGELKPDYRWDHSNHWWWDHQDVLDDRMGFFVGNMQPGKSVVDALIRMERPGEFGVNPVTLETMYSKQVRGYSTIDRLKVVE